MSNKVGVVHGRFQCLHRGHMEYIMAAFEKCDFLIIGITNFNPFDNVKVNDVDKNRFLDSSNPFTYFQRMEMIRDSLIENGVDKTKFDIVPFPIENENFIFNYVPLDATFFITIYDKWGEEKLKKLKSLNLEVDVLWKKDISLKPTSATFIRNLIKDNKPWSHEVPKSVYNYILKNDLVRRIK